jgi:hypothetical protein
MIYLSSVSKDLVALHVPEQENLQYHCNTGYIVHFLGLNCLWASSASPKGSL